MGRICQDLLWAFELISLVTAACARPPRKQNVEQGIFGLVVIVGVLILATLVILGLAAGARALQSTADSKKVRRPYQERQSISHDDLVDPQIRGDHLSYNTHLHKTFAGRRFVSVEGELGCHVAFQYSVCRDILNDHSSFSSNPYPSERLVALNTMDKVDHARVLRYVQGHYVQGAVEDLQEQLQSIVTKCTNELEGAAREGPVDVMIWAKRIHMASTLTRLGVQVSQNSSWDKVDGMVRLNDAMVALVAPLGGVGLHYSDVSFVHLLAVVKGLLCSIVPLVSMLFRIGLFATWAIVRPDVTLLWPSRQPRSGVWWHAHLLPLVPAYFMGLHEMLLTTNGGPLQAIRDGVEAGGLSMAEALTLMAQLMVNMTSANALGSLVFRLATEDAATKMVRQDPSQCAAFIQEVLRLDAPLQRNPRRVVSLGGRWSEQGLAVGNHVLVFIGAANMDPDVFESPEQFRLDREAKPLTFGSGIHYCLGSSLVKLEMQLALDCLLQRFSRFEVVASNRLDDVDVGNWGFKNLMLKL
mmetsp:Transcript_32809/g.60012  ORF Transcript_32809/g.60012 Transcript_32809/m.60012 type:complete len:527 (+) Transcript_32809:57-1637(+)